MVDDRSLPDAPTAARPNKIRPLPGAGGRPGLGTTLDAVDLKILAILSNDARIPNNALAAQVGIAPSTCLGRVRALRETGVIRGYYADIDPAALGYQLQAMIAVRLRAGARHLMQAFTDRIRARPEVRNLYFLAGADDFLLDVATTGAPALRDFVVEQLSAHPEVASTETNLIFEQLRGDAWLT